MSDNPKKPPEEERGAPPENAPHTYPVQGPDGTTVQFHDPTPGIKKRLKQLEETEERG